MAEPEPNEEKIPTEHTPRIGEVFGDAKSMAQGAYEQATGQAEEQVARLSEAIRDQPLTSALIALGLGYLLGRLIR